MLENFKNKSLIANETFDIEYYLNQIRFSNSTTDLPFDTKLFSIMYTFIFVIGIPTNLIVIYVYAIDKNTNKFTSFFFINLSISDILILLICLPVSVIDMMFPNEWFFGLIYCKFILF